MNDILSGTYKGNTYRIKVECYPNTPAIKVQLSRSTLESASP